MYDISEETDCWIWQGGKTIDGGIKPFIIQGHYVSVYRFSFELKFGPIPEQYRKLHVETRCGNKRCINPDHLALQGGVKMPPITEPLPYFDQVIKRTSDIRLTEKQAREIFNSELSNKQLALIYKVSTRTIRRIKTKKSWAHLHDRSENS